MYEFELGAAKDITEGKKGRSFYEARIRLFQEATTRIDGRLVVPMLPDFDSLGVSVMFNEAEIPKSFIPTPTHMEALITIYDDELAISALTSVFDKHFGKSHEQFQVQLEGQQ